MQFKESGGPVILGQTEDQKLAAIVDKVGTHLRMAHPKVFEETGVLAMEMAGYAILCQFETADEKINARRLKSAKFLYPSVARVLPDEDIDRIVKNRLSALPGEGGQTMLFQHEVVGLLRQMRDWLQYQDQEPKKAAVPGPVAVAK